MHTVRSGDRKGQLKLHEPLHIVVSAADARIMRVIIERRTVDPGTYNLFTNNCARFVEDVLHAGHVKGIPHRWFFEPALLAGIISYGNSFRN